MGSVTAEAVNELARHDATFQRDSESRTLDENRGGLAGISETDSGCAGRMDSSMDQDSGQHEGGTPRATGSGSTRAGTTAELDRRPATTLAELVQYREGHKC